ncbi:MAG: excinuclease ABC subunit UvrC [Veillonellaceae bacterium]|nr:excinuclease ABC subunit UvrC [Veillonellaceae bacterium]
MSGISEDLQAKVATMPTAPGVYRWRDRFGRIIYVGKAINLRNRVRSYIQNPDRLSPKVRAMMAHAVDVDIILTKTEMEALILECNLIKEHRPKYNILLRDDKTYPYVKITLQEDYPRVFMTRRLERDGARYLGPFTDVGAVARTLKLIRQLYPLRTCRSMRVDRPCLQYHLRRCEAPCVGIVEQRRYHAMAEEVCAIFEGKDTHLLRAWTKRMEEAAAALRYEEAGEWRDRIQALSRVQEKQHVIGGRGDLDVVGLAQREDKVAVVVLWVRAGKMIGKDQLMLSGSGGEDEANLLSAFLKSYYLDRPERVPKEILVGVLPQDAELLTAWLSDMRGTKVGIAVPARGMRRGLHMMAQDNAGRFLQAREAQWQYTQDKQEGAVRALAEVLDLPQLPERIECFDISHTQGEETVAAMTVLLDGKPAKSEYRKFKLKTVQGRPDDFASMREIMQRRYGNHPEWPLPDLIVIDGGKGQLHAALPVIRECGVQAPVIALAERLEEIFTEFSNESVILGRRHPALQMLQTVRDEAHRFGITYHRKLRSKRNFQSVLEHLPGIGPKRRQALWKVFGSLAEMRAATLDELAAVPGMTRSAAATVQQFLAAEKHEKQQQVRN